MEHIIELSNLKKSYGSVQAVQGIDFYVEKGKLFAFLGPNGAGKSTTIDMLCTLLQPDSGQVVINGYTLGRDDNQIRSTIGVVFQDSLLDPLLTVKENLFTRGGLYKMSKAELRQAVQKAAQAADVTEFMDPPYGKLSGGQRRRADIARALINTPSILFLDEPTTGLDPQTRKSVWETIQKLQHKTGMTVFLTTHYMEEAANADYVMIIDGGTIVAKGSPAELKEQYSSDNLKIQPTDMNLLKELLGDRVYSIVGNTCIIRLKKTTDALSILSRCEPVIENFEVTNGTMDDVFINITGREMREDA